MVFLIVPARNDLPSYRFKINLSGAIFTLRLRYNSRMDRWILDIADPTNNDILNGLPILVERDLAGRFVISGLPLGTFFATDDTGEGSQPTRYSFGTTHTLYYADPTQEAVA